MKRITASVLAFSAFSLLGGREIAHAQDAYFPNDATINYAVPGDAFIGMDSSYVPSGPTVSLVTGGDIGGDLHALNTSTVYITGGNVAGRLTAGQSAVVTISGGSIAGEVDAYENSIVNITGGAIGGDFDASFASNSHFNFYGVGLAATLIYASDPNDPDTSYLYDLSGTLRDGTVLANKSLYVLAPNQFTLINPVAAVPEPGVTTFAICTALSVCGLVLRRRARG